MSLLYKKSEDVVYIVNVNQKNGNVRLCFSAYCGKHGTDEMLDTYDLTPLELLTILQEHESTN